jgi:hypothetical protein
LISRIVPHVVELRHRASGSGRNGIARHCSQS